MAKHYEVAGKSVFITGGARGIGGSAASRLAARGARLTLLDRDADELERKGAELGPEALLVRGDVTDSADLERAVTQASDRFGGIDVVIANAGISGTPTPSATIDPAEWERVIEVNLLGVWRTVRAALPSVIERRGYALPIASVAAALPCPMISAYAASKHGVEGFAMSLRMELAHTGTKVGCGYFGFIDTKMVSDAFEAMERRGGMNGLPSRVRRPIPVSAAGAAIERGVMRRAKRVYAPGWVPGLLALRGLGGPLDDIVARHPRIAQVAAID